MKKFILAVPALLALAAVSCTKSEVLETNSGEIRFNVVANNATKAAAIYDNNNFTEFTVYAATSEDPATYIDGDLIKKENGAWVNKSGTRFWPVAALDFYALRNADGFEFTPGVTPSFDFTVESAVAQQKDLLYAVKLNQSRSTSVTGSGSEAPVVEGTPVTLNFRHALSQIVFQAKNTNKNLYAEISGVKIVNVIGNGKYTVSKSDTDAIKVVSGDNAGGSTDPVNDGSRGTWDLSSIVSDYNESYELDFSTAYELDGNSEVVALDGGNATASAMMLIPQDPEPWDPETFPAPAAEGQTGSYFLVNCVIWNVADPDNGHSADDLVIWGEKDGDAYTATPAEVAIPVDIAWKEGFKYVYTFVFGEGAGYDPEPEPGEDPKPAIIPISFTVSVDDFNVVSGGDYDVDLEPGA